MKKRIVVKNSPNDAPEKRRAPQDRDARLSSELRGNLKKRKAQSRAQTEASKNGSN